MSELIDNARKRRNLLKEMILQLHQGVSVDSVRTQLVRLLSEIPYEDVVEVEQELINEGLPEEEVLKLCDIHTEALGGLITLKGAKRAEPGHPVHTFQEENEALNKQVDTTRVLLNEISSLPADSEIPSHLMLALRLKLNELNDVEKHYLRKEYLMFPFLEGHQITGPPTVMWGKHDQTRELLRAAFEALEVARDSEVNLGEFTVVGELVIEPALQAIEGMISKEEEILLPMSMDVLSKEEWWQIYEQSPEFGFCLIDPVDWEPEFRKEIEESEYEEEKAVEKIRLPTGTFTTKELEAVLNTIPFDMTFVDANDEVRYFTHGQERIFTRNRAILGRKVQFCHPPSSVDTVEKILDAFHSGKKNHAQFWLTLGGKFISVEYFALRGKDGEFLGTLEVSQNLTEKRALSGEQRLLSWDEEDDTGE